MFRVLLIILLFACFRAPSVADPPYPTDYFRAPVGESIRLSGTFGELRPGHFHSGIDIKGVIGQTLYAAADGYVSRIRVSSGGYGKVIYLTHPNGYTTVYAHMNNFTPELEAYVKKAQYARRSFELQLYPGKGTFTFRKGEPIGAMGISGNSFGPHLHFEVRNSSNSKPINPLLFGFPFVDDDPPRIHQLRVYGLDDRLATLEAKSYEVVGSNGKFRLAGDNPIRIPAWRAGFALEVYDHMNRGANRNGVYKLEMRVDGELVYAFDLETFSFSETRYLNAHVDFAMQVEEGDLLHRFYKLPGNRLSIYRREVNQGAVKLFLEKARQVVLRTEDAFGNTAELTFEVLRAEIPEEERRPAYDYLLPYDRENVIDNYGIYLRFPRGAFYEDLPLRYHSTPAPSGPYFSDLHHLHRETTPVHRSFELRLRPALMPDALREKAFVARLDEDGEVVNCGGTWKNGLLVTDVRRFGDYIIMADQTPPSVEPVVFTPAMRGQRKMVFRIKDDLPTDGSADGLTYEARVDGDWILMEYDAKNDLLIHRFDGRIKAGDHELVIRVSDGLNNTTVWKNKFSL